MSFNLQSFNNISPSAGLTTGSALVPVPVATATRTRPNLTGSTSGILSNTSIANTGSITSGNTGTVIPGNGATGRSREELEQVLQATKSTTGTTVQPTFWEKYKVWIIPSVALLVIAVALYFYFKK